METVRADIGAIVVRPKGELVVSNTPENQDDRCVMLLLAEHLSKKGRFVKMRTSAEGLALIAL